MRKILATLVAAATIYSGSASAQQQHINGYGYGNGHFHNHGRHYQRPWDQNRQFHGHHGGGHYRGHGGGGAEWVVPLIGGLMIGGLIANSYQPYCETVYAGQQWNGWQWVNVYQRVCR